MKILNTLLWSIVGLGVTAFTFSSLARAEICPVNQPTWIRGKVTRNRPNLNPPAIRGVGEIFIYAFPPGNSAPNTRFMAVSDDDGNFCIHDTFEGDWALTSFEPFTLRPFVREIHCSAGQNCDLGEIRLDQYVLSISDDDVNYQEGYWGGPWAQTAVTPPGTVSISKATFRSGGEGTQIEVRLFNNQSLLPADLVGASGLIVGSGDRGTAVFFHQNGVIPVQPSSAYTFFLSTGGPYRLFGDKYVAGQMYKQGIDQNSLPFLLLADDLIGADMCLTADFDGPDGNLTNYLVLGTPANTWGNTVAQTFVARSVEINHVSMIVGVTNGLKRIQASISETFDGPPIGSVKETKGLDNQGVAFAWFAGEVPVTPGNTYFVRFHFPEGGLGVYSRLYAPINNLNPYPDGQVYSDGNPGEGDITGRVMGPMSSTPLPDADGDGYNSRADCDDNEATIHPGATEICGDGIDQDCDTIDPPCPCTDTDDDQDGYVSEECSGGTDCDDHNPNIHPGAAETCEDGIDQDCDDNDPACEEPDGGSDNGADQEKTEDGGADGGEIDGNGNDPGGNDVLVIDEQMEETLGNPTGSCGCSVPGSSLSTSFWLMLVGIMSLVVVKGCGRR